jgi:hypothetical protein
MRKIVGIVVFVQLTLACLAQLKVDLTSDVKTGENAFFEKFVPQTGDLLFFRETTSSSQVSVKIVKPNGTTVSIFAIRDLPDAKVLNIWAIDQTPDGGVSFSAIAEYTPAGVKPKVFKSLVMTYDGTGSLRKLWDVYPYHHHHLTIDIEGNLWALGTKDTTKKDYPLLIKYSPTGKVLGEFLPASQFPMGDAVVESGSINGETRLYAVGNEIMIWFAPSLELVRLAANGDIKRRSSWASLLRTIAESKGDYVTRVGALFPEADGAVGQLQLWNKDTKKRGVQTAVFRFAPDGSYTEVTQFADFKSTGRLLGPAGDGKLLYMEAPPPGTVGAVFTRR